MLPKTEYELTAKERYDRHHIFTVATKLNVQNLDAFDAVCASAGISRYEAIRRFCLACIKRPETLSALKWQRSPRKK